MRICRYLVWILLLALVACDGSGSLGDDDAYGDDDDGATAAPCSPAVVSFEAPTIDWFWIGGAPSPVQVPFETSQGSCPVTVRADAPFVTLAVEVMDEDSGESRLSVGLDPSTVVGGVHQITVRFTEEGGDEVLASFPMRVRALGSAKATVRRALVVGVDGVRGDAWVAANTLNTDLLTQHAAWTAQASTQLDADTNSGPGWTSILTGVDAQKHNVWANGGYEDRDTTWPSFLKRASDAGLSTAAAIHWVPILSGILEDDCCGESFLGEDQEIADEVSRWLQFDNHDLHFVHLDDVDGAGHGSGFSSDNPSYLAAIELADQQIGEMLDALLLRESIADEHWMVVFTTDHGGTGNGHGCLTSECREIPLVIASPSLTPGSPPLSASHKDVHPTVLDFLGVTPQAGWVLDGEVLGLPWEGDCDDGLDGDGDGAVDCDDEDCFTSVLCTCPEVELAGGTGFALASGETGAFGDEFGGTCGGDGAPDVTLAWTAPSSDLWTFDLTGSHRDFDTVLYALDGGCDGPELACDDDSSGPQSAFSLDMSAGQELTLVVDGAAGGSGSWQLNAEAASTCPDNDLEGAVGSGVASGNNDGQGATFFASCARSGRDVVHTWTAPSSGSFGFDTYGSGYDTVLHVREGACGGDEIACADDSGGGYQSELTFEATAGVTYTVVVSGFNGRPEPSGGLPSGGTSDYVLNITSPL